MKRTDMLVAVARHSTWIEFRAVYKDGDRYIIRWKGEVIDVTEDIENRNYSYK